MHQIAGSILIFNSFVWLWCKQILMHSFIECVWYMICLPCRCGIFIFCTTSIVWGEDNIYRRKQHGKYWLWNISSWMASGSTETGKHYRLMMWNVCLLLLVYKFTLAKCHPMEENWRLWKWYILNFAFIALSLDIVFKLRGGTSQKNYKAVPTLRWFWILLISTS